MEKCNNLKGWALKVKKRFQNVLLCVEWDVKPYSLRVSVAGSLLVDNLTSPVSSVEMMQWQADGFLM